MLRTEQLLAYMNERGARFEMRDGQLYLKGREKLSETAFKVLQMRRAEIYRKFGIEPPTEADMLFGSKVCPHCGKEIECTSPPASTSSN